MAELHKLVQQQAALMEQAAAQRGTEETAAQRRVAGNAKGDRAEDPRTVLVSSLGGGSGSRSAPSTNRSSAVRTSTIPIPSVLRKGCPKLLQQDVACKVRSGCVDNPLALRAGQQAMHAG